MKKMAVIRFTVLSCTLGLILFSAVYPRSSVQAAPPTEIPKEIIETCDTGRTVQVSGTAVINVTPDRALIQLGVQSLGDTPAKVEMGNSFAINRVVRALKALGIAEKDIVTDWYVIEPVYKDRDRMTIMGYRIDNIVSITLRDTSKVNKVISTALYAGANQVVNLEFYLSDLREYRDQARALAVRAAREKAQDLAIAAGARTGCVMSINENIYSQFYGGWYGQTRNLWASNMIQNSDPVGSGAGGLDDDGPVNIGKVSVRAEVSAVFSLK